MLQPCLVLLDANLALHLTAFGLAAPITASAESSSNTEQHSQPLESAKAVAAFDSLISKRNVKDTLDDKFTYPYAAGLIPSNIHSAGSLHPDRTLLEATTTMSMHPSIQKRWQEAGLPSTHIKSYYPLLNFPIARFSIAARA
ncbi:hypothetical protein BSLG_006579 [Batrachochytrium salamandrivorans]|nr:hypothetical protein BSLG_006579 [Batrachochytrium salamandrivorans]